MTAGRTNIAREREVEGAGLDSRFELDFLEGDELSGELVPGLVHAHGDTGGSLVCGGCASGADWDVPPVSPATAAF